MTIRIDDNVQSFSELLFVRTGWQLAVPEVPATETSGLIPPMSQPGSRSSAELHDDWLADWRAGWTRYDVQVGAATPPDQQTLDLIANTPDGELHDKFGGRLGHRIPETELDAFNTWQESLREPHDLPLAQTPERLSLPALIGAWERGLKTILQLPFAGHYAVSRNEEYLAVSRHTRSTPELFTQALERH